MTTIKVPTKAKFLAGLKEIVDSIKDVNVKAEADFILDNYNEKSKDLTKEEMQHMIVSLDKVGLQLPTATKPVVKKETSTKKPVAKKEEKQEKRSVATVTPNMTPETDEFYLDKNEYLANFPKTINHPNLGRLVIRDDVQTLADLTAEMEKFPTKKFVFANHWSERTLLQFNYDSMGILKDYPQYFPMDLDFTYPIHCSDIVCYTVSFYTQVSTTYTAHGFSRQDKKSNCRYSNGLEYQLYEVQE